MLKYFCLFASIALVCAQTLNLNESTVSPLEVNNKVSTNGTTKLSSVVTNSTTPTQKSTNITTTTTTSTTTTTTVKSTTAVITTTPIPNPPPIPTPNKLSGNVTDNKTSCILFEFAVKITFKYNTTEGLKSTGFVFPQNSTVDSNASHCSNESVKSETVAITFVEPETTAELFLTFNKSDSGVYVEEIKLSFKATNEFMPGSHVIGTEITATKSNLTLFKVAKQHSYLCSAGQGSPLDSQNDNIHGVQIEFTDSKVEAYANSESGNYDSAIDCKSADISDVVPIAVGAALAGLVIIVLIAYFIGRRRSRRLAYQSV